MGMKVGTGKGAMSEPNIVPFIDILLVLIIIFMVITPLIPKGLDALVPQPPPPGTQTQEDVLQRTIVIQVLRGGPTGVSVKINQDEVTWDTLGFRLSEIFKTRAEKIAFVKGDDMMEFAEVARAIDIAKAAGVEKIGLMTAKVEAGQ